VIKYLKFCKLKTLCFYLFYIQLKNEKSMLRRIKVFFQESKQELKKVNWPTRQETIRYTLFVISISLVVAIFLGFFDFIFLRLLSLIV